MLKNEVALITGGARGIGYAIAEKYAENGATVIINAAHEETADKAVSALREKGYKAYPCVFDVTDREHLFDAVKKVTQITGDITILVNNAGISPKKDGKPVAVVDMDFEEWQHVMDVNLNGMFNCAQAVLPSMLKAASGKIINISSASARVYTDFTSSHYITSKTAIIGFTHALAGELALKGIQCNCIAPGRCWTDMTRRLPLEANNAIAETILTKRLGETEEVANVALFLAAKGTEYMTGTTIDINGGYFMS